MERSRWRLRGNLSQHRRVNPRVPADINGFDKIELQRRADFATASFCGLKERHRLAVVAANSRPALFFLRFWIINGSPNKTSDPIVECDCNDKGEADDDFLEELRNSDDNQTVG
jgi:hypothetical protein